MALTCRKRHMPGVWFPLVSLFFTLNASAGFVTNDSWLEYREIGSSASLVYFVHDIRLYEVPDVSKCSLGSGLYNCSTPTGPCGDNDRTRLVLTQKDNEKSWRCSIEITNVQEDDVGEYFLCQLDISTVPPECHNVHKTYLHAWYMSGNNERCNITYYDKGTRTKTCPPPLTGTTGGTTAESSSSLATTTEEIQVAGTQKTEFDTNIADERRGGRCVNVIPVVVGVIFAVVVLGVVIVLLVRRWRLRSAAAQSTSERPDCEVPMKESLGP